MCHQLKIFLSKCYQKWKEVYGFKIDNNQTRQNNVNRSKTKKCSLITLWTTRIEIFIENLCWLKTVYGGSNFCSMLVLFCSSKIHGKCWILMTHALEKIYHLRKVCIFSAATETPRMNIISLKTGFFFIGKPFKKPSSATSQKQKKKKRKRQEQSSEPTLIPINQFISQACKWSVLIFFC